jgi:hypothetical protein
MIPSTIAQEKYLVKQLQIQESSIPDIDSEVIAAARSGHSYDELLVTGRSQLEAPRCRRTPDETFHHLLQCPHERVRKLCTDSLKHIEQVGASLKIPTSIIWLVLQILQHECALANHPPPTDPKLLQLWEAQSKFSFSNFILRWFSRLWRNALQQYGSDDSSGQATQLLTLMGWTLQAFMDLQK